MIMEYATESKLPFKEITFLASCCPEEGLPIVNQCSVVFLNLPPPGNYSFEVWPALFISKQH